MTPTLLDRLLAHRALGSVPREQLEWLANAGHLCVLEPGDILTTVAAGPRGLFVVFEGHLSIRLDRGTGSRIVMEWHGGDVTGVLPYSRVKNPPGNVIAERRCELLMLEREHLPRLMRECPDLTAVLVHVMLDRARAFKSSELLDEKLSSLGKLAAGLAHELNNPASAVARSAKALVQELDVFDRATRRFVELDLRDTQVYSVAALRDERTVAAARRSPMEVADREDALSEWLETHGISGVELEPLAAQSYEPSDLDALSDMVGAHNIGPVLAHLSSRAVMRRLAAEISAAASRIHKLVAAVKGFTYMDHQVAMEPVAIGRGLEDTITILGAKARSRSVEVKLDVATDLPAVDAIGGELNQVWVNLIDNAIDATPGGHVGVRAGVELGKVVVRVTDDGPGIPAEVVGRIFDPFFTTKPVGDGIGLGLDIARRIVVRHHGEIDISTNDAGTEFRVTLPLAAAPPAV